MTPRIVMAVSSMDRPIHLLGTLTQFSVQTDPNWELHILQDGPNPAIREIVRAVDTSGKFVLHELPKAGYWGFPHREAFIQSQPSSTDTWICLTNDDNYYAPVFVEYMRQIATRPHVGMVMCDFATRNRKWNVIESKPEFDHILMGAFMVRMDVAQAVKFRDYSDVFSDSRWVEDLRDHLCEIGLQIARIPHVLFVHN